MKNIGIQLIGAIAYIILAASYHKKKKKDILFLQIFSTIAFALHYYLLSGFTGTICNIISLITIIIIYFFEKCNNKNKKLLIYITIPLLILISLLTYENIFSIFPIISTSIILISFILSDENKIRVTAIFSSLCWIIYATIYKSYVGMIFESVTMISTIIAYLKHKKNK